MKRTTIWIGLGLLGLALAGGDAFAERRGGERARGKPGLPAQEALEVDLGAERVAQKGQKAEKPERLDKAVKEHPKGGDVERHEMRPDAARERLSREEREQLREEEGPGFWGRMRRFFGWERSEQRRSEQGQMRQRATEQDRGPAER